MPDARRGGREDDRKQSHAYAAVTAPKATGPLPDLEGIVAAEPEPDPGHVLIGAYPRALREGRGHAVEEVALGGHTTPTAVLAAESGAARFLNASPTRSSGTSPGGRPRVSWTTSGASASGSGTRGTPSSA